MNACVHRLVLSAAVATTLTGVSLLAQGQGHKPPATFRSSVDLVSIQASVKDRRGRPVRGLTTADFEVRDNGQPRPILSMRSDQPSAVSLAILVDMSGSMRVGSKIAMARQAFDHPRWPAARRGGRGRALHVRLGAPRAPGVHERLPRLSRRARRSRPFGTTSLYDATAATARRLAERPATHKAIIVLTDGIDTSSALTLAEVSGVASSIDVPVYVVATVPSIDQRAMLEAATHSTASDGADLRDLAEWTGGQLVFAHNAVETVTLASNLLDELRQQYVLAIEAAGDRRVATARSPREEVSAIVKARSGYFGDSSNSGFGVRDSGLAAGDSDSRDSGLGQPEIAAGGTRGSGFVRTDN